MTENLIYSVIFNYETTKKVLYNIFISIYVNILIIY